MKRTPKELRRIAVKKGISVLDLKKWFGLSFSESKQIDEEIIQNTKEQTG